MHLYCCGCEKQVVPTLVSGDEVYKGREDLKHKKLWKCDFCGNYVGCHKYKQEEHPRPLGCIPTAEIRKARMHIHEKLDPMWQSKKLTRRQVYAMLSERLGYTYHTGTLVSIDECRRVYRILITMTKELNNAQMELF